MSGCIALKPPDALACVCMRTHACHEPVQVRDVVHDFYNSRYGRCFAGLEALTPALAVDIHLHDHVGALMKEIRTRALVQVGLCVRCLVSHGALVRAGHVGCLRADAAAPRHTRCQERCACAADLEPTLTYANTPHTPHAVHGALQQRGPHQDGGCLQHQRCVSRSASWCCCWACPWTTPCALKHPRPYPRARQRPMHSLHPPPPHTHTHMHTHTHTHTNTTQCAAG
jgi:hypothetical protein